MTTRRNLLKGMLAGALVPTPALFLRDKPKPREVALLDDYEVGFLPDGRPYTRIGQEWRVHGEEG